MSSSKYPSDDRTTTYDTLDEAKVYRLRNYLANFNANNDDPKRYAILVDGQTVVPATDEIEHFDTYKEYMDDLSEEVEVRIFFGNSPKFKRHVFTVKEQEEKPFKPFREIPSKSDNWKNPQFQLHLQQTKWEFERERMEESIRKKSKKISKLKEYIAELEKENEELDNELKNIQDDQKGGLNGFGGALDKWLPLLFGGKIQDQSLPPAQEVSGIEVTEVKEEKNAFEQSDKIYEKLKSRTDDKTLCKLINTCLYLAQNPDVAQKLNEIINQTETE